MAPRTGQTGKLSFPAHPHMLRRACGRRLANDGQDTRAAQRHFGRKTIPRAARYAELSPERFKVYPRSSSAKSLKWG